MSQKITILVLSILVLFLGCSKKENLGKEYDQTLILKNLSENFISKGLKQFKNQSITLDLAINQYLLTKSNADLLHSQKEWKQTIDDWRICELFNIGEIKNSFLFNRIDSWNTDTLDIIKTLKSSSIISQKTINSKPSNNVGLYALEYFLFDNSLTKDPRYYSYLAGLSENIKIQTEKLYLLWTDSYRSNFENSKGVNLSSSISEILNYQPMICEEVLRDKISVPLGYYSYIDFNKKTLEAWRSRYSLEIISNTFYNIKDLYYGKGAEGIDDYLLFLEDTSTTIKADMIFNDTELKLKKINGPLIQTLASEEANLLELRTSFKKIRALFAVDIISSIGIMGTFSDIDGD